LKILAAYDQFENLITNATVVKWLRRESYGGSSD